MCSLGSVRKDTLAVGTRSSLLVLMTATFGVTHRAQLHTILGAAPPSHAWWKVRSALLGFSLSLHEVAPVAYVITRQTNLKHTGDCEPTCPTDLCCPRSLTSTSMPRIRYRPQQQRLPPRLFSWHSRGALASSRELTLVLPASRAVLQTGVDHPLCAECTEKILGEIEEQLKGAAPPPHLSLLLVSLVRMCARC
jgi:hypothetical protein